MYLSQFHWGGWTYSLLNKGKREGIPLPCCRAPPSHCPREGPAQCPCLQGRQSRSPPPGGPSGALEPLRGPAMENAWPCPPPPTWAKPPDFTRFYHEHLLMHPPHTQPLKNSRVVFFCSCSFVYSALRTLAVLFFPECLRFLSKYESAERHVSLPS